MNRDVEQWTVSKRAVASTEGVVAAQHMLAARAGAGMLADGGNAVDAAVAAAMALGVVEPWMCGLGGSGYIVVWLAETKQARMIDFQGMLPAAISGDDYPLDPDVPWSIMGFPGVIDRQNEVGYRSISVPGAVMGLTRALELYGRFGLDRVLSPAIALSERGLPCSWFTTLQTALAMADLRRDPAASAIYLPNGAPPQPEQFLPLGKLSETLRTLADEGPGSFYRGRLAERMADDLKAGGSRIDGDDLSAYSVLESDVLSTNHRGVCLHTAGPTSGGPRLIDTLDHIDRHLQPGSAIGPESWKIYADALNQAWRKHKQRMGRVTEVGSCTSHLSAVDADGNMVALTFTLLNRFGSCAVLPSTGILMNNAVSYFDPSPGFPTSMEGRKRINASNMCPTIGTRDDEAIFAPAHRAPTTSCPAPRRSPPDARFRHDPGRSDEPPAHRRVRPWFDPGRSQAGRRRACRIVPGFRAGGGAASGVPETLFLSIRRQSRPFKRPLPRAERSLPADRRRCRLRTIRARRRRGEGRAARLVV